MPDRIELDAVIDGKPGVLRGTIRRAPSVVGGPRTIITLDENQLIGAGDSFTLRSNPRPESPDSLP